ncbi:hypothetical protein FB45DRAFT_1053643 [Roridomyces roridus]|uniref:Uncharacterized protein n=1 Tax=Roridomyces roridus TaxID=1738132 RepID=A0AAD7FSP1_9AGAR|nr:hypothetical protein FB45DRAFT_1053643 [Roridomyces roridus]
MIFKKCLALEFSDSPPSAFTAPMLLTQIALVTPSLWTNIHITSPSQGFQSLLKVWLDRAQRLPAKISLDGRRESAVEDVVRERAGQFADLEVWEDTQDQGREIDPWDLGNIARTPFLTLDKLTLGSNRATNRQTRLGINTCLEFLHNTPRLGQCTLIGWANINQVWLSEPRMHTCLRQLDLGHWSRICTAQVLEQLTLPALEFLHLSTLDIKLDEFEAFFTRSAAPLRTLQLIAHPSSFWMEYCPRTDAVSLCRLVPRLHHIDILFDAYDMTIPFFNALRTEPEFLPSIVSIAVRVRWPEDLSVFCEQLRDVLSARRRTFQSFKLFQVDGYDSREEFESDQAQIAAALGGLVEDGMHLEIDEM